MVYAYHLPLGQGYAANRPSQVFRDVRHPFLEYLTRQVLFSISNSSLDNKVTEEAHSSPVVQIPYFDNIGVNDANAVLERSISEIETRPQATPVS